MAVLDGPPVGRYSEPTSPENDMRGVRAKTSADEISARAEKSEDSHESHTNELSSKAAQV